MKYDYDCVVVGAGSGGLTAAESSQKLGFRTLLIDKEKPGGDCTWSGCVPSKAIIHAANEARLSRGNNVADMEQTHNYVQRKIMEVYSLEGPEQLEQKSISFVTGEVEFASKHEIVIKQNGGEKYVTSKVFIIATGALPTKLDVEGIDTIKNKWNYQQIWSVKALPNKLAVIGSGPIGAELAQAFSRLGSETTIFGSEFLAKEVDHARDIILKRFRSEGIKFVKGRPEKAVQNEDGSITIVVGDTHFHVDGLLYSIGRSPVLPKGLKSIIGKDAVGINGGIIVDQYLQTKNSKNIYACGDCIDGNPQFTHYAGKQGWYCVRNAFLVGKSKGLIPEKVPRVTFTSPEIGGVGFATITEARAKGFKNAVAIRKHGLHVDRAVCDDENETTYLELILSNARSKSAKIIGGTCVGPRAGETICEIALAINNKISLENVADTIHPYPTYGFGLQHLCSEEATKRFVNSITAKIAKWI